MKSYRVEFQHGINTVGDKAVLPNGWVSVAENVDLRSGVPRPIKAPSYFANVAATTTRIFEYRGEWYYSERWRDYETEYINGRDRIYFTESGEATITATLTPPSKIIEKTQVKLGRKRPLTPPLVSLTSKLTPTVTSTVSTTGGNYSKNTSTSFRVAARTSGGVMPPSASEFTQFDSSTDTNKVSYTWSLVDGGIGYLIFVGPNPDEEQLVAELGAFATAYNDLGNVHGSGDFASNYDTKAPYSYIYTFLREVSTVQDESAPSDPSRTVETNKVRRIAFNPMTDGFLNSENALSIDAASISITGSLDYIGSATISGFSASPFQKRVKFITETPHNLLSGGQGKFINMSDTAYNNRFFDVTPDTSSPTAFYVSGFAPSGTTVGASIIPSRTGIAFLTPPTTPPVNGDAIYCPIANSANLRNTYAATSCGATSCEINAFTASGATVTSFKYVPKNDYIKYRNLYRLGDSSKYSLVAQVPITQDYWIDGANADTIPGDSPDSYYEEGGQTIIYDTPPLGMTGLVWHYGMLFGIEGNTVRWTPTGRPDAWPANFAITFPWKPLALASWGQSLVVLCTDSLYLINGNIPTQLSPSRSQATDGCIAPHSVQKTHSGLIYLSKRGIMLFDGSRAECLTDSRIPSQFFQGPSALSSDINYWWHPTVKGYNYQNLASQDGIVGPLQNSMDGTTPIDGPNYAARSFVHLGKYYLYWTTDGNYEGHTCVSVDLQAPGMPLSTLGMKIVDAHVDGTGKAYILAKDRVAGG